MFLKGDEIPKAEVKSCAVTGNDGVDYTVRLELTDGRFINVLIPTDFESDDKGNLDNELITGLNMVTWGHYK